MTPVFSSTQRRATPKIFAVTLVIAMVCYAAINSLGKQIDARRLEQLRVSRLDNEITTVLGDMDSYLLGEDVDEFRGDFREMNEGLDALAIHGGTSSIAEVVNAYGGFTQAVEGELSLVRAKEHLAARRYDRGTTDPAFDRLKGALASFDAQLEGEAALRARIADAAIGGTLLASALLVASLVLRFQKKVESLIALEVQQNSIESSERKLKSLVRNNSDIIALITAEGIVTMVSDACERCWGLTAEEVVGRCVFDRMDGADATRIRRLLAEHIDTKEDVPMFEVSMADTLGVRRSFEVQMSSLLDDPDVRSVLLTFHDLTERKKYESQLTYHAFHDRLTTLPNRALFLDRLSHRLRAQENGGEGFAVLFIDLDNFKIINDSLGHEAGDVLLMEVAARLQSTVRPVDTVARLGGDEFTIILDETRCPKDATDVAERIQKALLMPVALGDREVFVTSSIGVVMTGDSGTDAADLLRDADTAMYHAKENGKASFALFEPGMNLLALDRLELESDLRVAIQEGQFYLAYQPIVDIATGRLREVEALIRWQHPTKGLVSPNAFIPLAEETGLICPIGRWALRESFAQLAAWNRDLRGEERLHLSVNVSGRQFQEVDFVAEVQACLEETAIDSSLVELEVTETAMLKDLAKMKTVFTQLRNLGLRVAIDDFGTGYSSMAYLSQLPVDKLKIDRSFVIPLGQDERADGVVQAMVTMARTLGLGITGEGIETAEQLTALQNMGCDLGQGFLFDRPLSVESVTRLVSQASQDRSELPLAA